MHKRKVRKGNGRIHDLLKFINSDINIYYIVQWFTFFLPYIYSEKEREGGGWGMGEGWITENLLPQENYFMDRFASDKKYKNKIFLCLAVWKFLLLFFVKKKDLFRGPFSVIPLIAHVLWMCVCLCLRVAADLRKWTFWEIDVVAMALLKTGHVKNSLGCRELVRVKEIKKDWMRSKLNVPSWRNKY